MKIAPLGEVKNNFSHYVDLCEKEPVIVTRNGRVAAVLEHMDEEDLDVFLLGRSPSFRAMIDRASKGKAIPFDEVMKKHGFDKPVVVRETGDAIPVAKSSARKGGKKTAKYKISKARR